MPKLYILLAPLASMLLGCGSYDEYSSFQAEKCGKNYYDPEVQFCQNAKIYDKCGGHNYDVLYQKCENNKLFLKCGDEWYNPSYEYCASNNVEKKKEFTDSRDDKVYKYVSIGSQIWMAENMQYKTSNTKCYDNNPSNCKIFGTLYDWNTAKNVCPPDWHLPNDDEWIKLRDYVGNNANKLKANDLLWEHGRGTDNFGFTALPGGFYRGDRGGFNQKNIVAGFWSATAGSETGSAHFRYLNNNSFGLDGFYINNSWANVRCIKDI